MVVVGVVVVVDADGALTTARPFAETTYHLAPKFDVPSPVVWPARLSRANV